VTQSIPKHIEIARDYGIVKLGYTLEDYLKEAVHGEIEGYETVVIWGVQGSGKSTRALQMANWIYDDWEKVLANVVFKPSEIVSRLEAVPDGERISCLVWDDVGVHYPSSKFKTDIEMYEAIDSAWAAIRTKVAVAILTIPLITRLAKNLRDNITFEVFLGRNQKEIIKRIFHLPGTERIESNLFKVTAEWPEAFNLYKVPKPIWTRYWKKRLKLTREAIETLKGAADMEDTEGYLPVLDAALKVRESGHKITGTTIQQNISRGVMRGRKFKGQLYVFEKDLNKFLESKQKKHQKTQ